MFVFEIIIINKFGLYVCVVVKFVGVVGCYFCQVWVGCNFESCVDGKSIMVVMMLVVGKGINLYLYIEGEQEDEVLNVLVELINNRFDEGEQVFFNDNEKVVNWWFFFFGDCGWC